MAGRAHEVGGDFRLASFKNPVIAIKMYLFHCCCLSDQNKEADNAVVGPLPLIQDAANQELRE